MTKLLGASLNSSLSTYRRPWILIKEFERIRSNTDNIEFPISSDTLALFIASLYEHSYSHSTVLTYISAIGYAYRVANFPDPSKSKRVQLILRGYSKLRPTGADTRLPITLPLLERIIMALNKTQTSHFQRKLIQAMCSLAFFAALRVGEFTIRPGQPLVNIIHLSNISFMTNQEGAVTAIKVPLRSKLHVTYETKMLSLQLIRCVCTCFSH